MRMFMPKGLHSQNTTTVKIAIQFFILGFSAIFLFGCTTTKKRGQVSNVAKFWHDTNARFNGYFNSRMILMEVTEQLEAQHTDNYNQILPLYTYQVATNPQSVANELDRVIEKSTFNINIHKPGNWTDDSYLNIGKSQFLKQDFESAEETLEFMIREYSPDALIKREKERKAGNKKKKKKKKRKRVKKKKKKRKKSGKKKKKKDADEEAGVDFSGGSEKMFKHDPAYQEGLIWLSRTYIERDNYSSADYYLRELENAPALLEEMTMELPVARAQFYLSQKKYESAVPALEQAVTRTKDRRLKGRYAFILGQVQKRNGQYDGAFAAWGTAEQYSPDYEMVFHAQLYKEEMAWQIKQTTTQEAIRRLERMLKDRKNDEYQDEIYYIMGKIALESGDRVAALEYFRAALAPGSQADPAIKTEIYYQLATLSFEQQEFVDAKSYFDSTLMVMEKADERYPEVKSLADNLADIASLITLIETQDSLLSIAVLSDEEREELAKRIIAEREQQALLAAQQAAREASEGEEIKERSYSDPGKPGSGQSSWPFYFQRQVEQGIRDFERKWGDRPLEDNWRRSQRSDAGLQIAGQDIDAQAEEEEQDPYADLFAGVPFAPEAQEAALAMLDSAHFRLGMLYRDKLQLNENAVDILEKLLRRFPETSRELNALYYLYLAHRDLNELERAKKYADLICDKYSGSLYCRVLTDPDAVAEELDKQKQLERFYEQVFNTFSEGGYQQTMALLNEVPSRFGNQTYLQPKFALLAAMCQGNLQGKQEYIDALKNVVAKYPDTPEETRAKEILRLLGGVVQETAQSGPASENEGESEASELYEQADDQLHYAICVLKDPALELEQGRIGISDFHSNYHSTDRLKVSIMLLSAQTDDPDNPPLLVVRRFRDKEEAMKYYASAMKNLPAYLPSGQYDFYIINQTNYRTIIREKSMKGYNEFFEATYLSETD